MKNVLTTLTILIALTMSYSFTTINNDMKIYEKSDLTSDYCEGWKDGYCEGWKDVKGPFAICPITPICPLAKIECSEGYKCGYNRGFKAGMKAARND